MENFYNWKNKVIKDNKKIKMKFPLLLYITEKICMVMAYNFDIFF